MAVVISNGDTTLGTASGFYRVEAHNLAMFSATDLILTSSRQISVTFANAGNCQGAVIALVPQTAAAASTHKEVTVKLQENVATVWTDRASATLTGAQIGNSITGNVQCDGIITAFTFGTPYAVTTAGSTWRLDISQGSGTNNWAIRTSNATAPFYATWCDNALSFTSGDTLICKDQVTADATTTIGSVLGTGDSTNGVAVIVCKSSSAPHPSNAVGNFQIGTSSAITLSIGGLIVGGMHSGIRGATSGSRQSYANQAHIQFTAPTVGTAAGDICSTEGPNSNGTRSKMSVIFYGAYPTVEDCELNADTVVNATTFTSSTDASSWLNGWRVFVSKQNLKNVGDTTLYTLNGAPSWSGSATTFTTTAGLATNVRKSGGKIVTLDGYGFRITSSNTSFRWRLHLAHPSNFVMSGVQQEEFTVGDNAVGNNTSNTYSLDDAGNRAQFVFEHCSMYSTQNSTSCHGNTTAPPEGFLIDHVNSIRSIPFNSPTYGSVPNGSITYTNCICQSLPAIFTPVILFTNGTTSGNVWENTATTYLAGATNGTFTNNEFFGGSGTIHFQVQNVVNCTFSGNTYNQLVCAISFASTIINCLDTDSQFGNEAANTTDINFLLAAAGISAPLVDYEFASPTGNLVISETNLTSSVSGSHLRVSDFNDTANDDRNWLKYGKIVRTGTGLSDTTARTAGGYAIRFEPDDDGAGTNLLKWAQSIPTGNIQNLTMSVSVWCYINNTAYDAGTYTMPTLRVRYDNATDITAVATASFGSWQRLSVTFTPTTTYGQIIATLEAATSASGSNAYVYFDDWNVAYPAGVAPNFGGMDLWANAMPITPVISTVSADSGTVWDALTANHTISGSFGSKEAKDLTLGQFIALK